jgi:ABC-type dipeptide/oligopeptide/nickel transport system permease component
MEIAREPDLARAEARLPRWMLGCALVGLLTLCLCGRLEFAAGFGLGAAVAVLNYYWLHHAVETLLAAGRARPSKWVVMKFLVRYPLAFAAVWAFYRTGWVPVLAILAGLFVPVAGVLIEGVVQLSRGLSN